MKAVFDSIVMNNLANDALTNETTTSKHSKCDMKDYKVIIVKHVVVIEKWSKPQLCFF